MVASQSDPRLFLNASFPQVAPDQPVEELGHARLAYRARTCKTANQRIMLLSRDGVGPLAVTRELTPKNPTP